MQKKEIMEKLYTSIVEYNEDQARDTANILVQEGYDPSEFIKSGLSKGMRIVGEQFEKGEAFLPELIMAGDVFNTAMQILEPEIIARGHKIKNQGAVVIGTVKSDVHEIGKDIVAMHLKTAGFEVYNIGMNVDSSVFLEEAERVKADIIGLSSLLTTTMPAQKEVLDLMQEQNIRKRYYVMIGGGPVTQKWADEIGADGYAKDAEAAVSLARSLMAKRQNG